MTTPDRDHADLASQPWSVPAIVSYMNLLIFLLAGGGVFLIIAFGVTVDAVHAGLLGAVLGSSGTGVAASNNFWLGNTSSGKQAQADTAKAAGAAQAALAQIAGSGAPPPAEPMNPIAQPDPAPAPDASQPGKP